MLYGETTRSPLVSWNQNTFKIFNIKPILLLRSGHTIYDFRSDFSFQQKLYFMNTKVKSNGMSGCVNTWPFELPVQQMQNRLELGCKIVQCDSNFCYFLR